MNSKRPPMSRLPYLNPYKVKPTDPRFISLRSAVQAPMPVNPVAFAPAPAQYKPEPTSFTPMPVKSTYM